MKKNDLYQDFWKSAKTEDRVHGCATPAVADELRRLGFHEDALPTPQHSIDQSSLDLRSVLPLRSPVPPSLPPALGYRQTATTRRHSWLASRPHIMSVMGAGVHPDPNSCLGPRQVRFRDENGAN